MDKDIKTSISTQIIIKVKFADEDEYMPVGAIKGIVEIQERDVYWAPPERGDYHTTRLEAGLITTKIVLNRIYINGKAMADVFCGQKPFDVEVSIADVSPGGTTTYHNCYMMSSSRAIKADDYVIVENVVLVCEKIIRE
jgi:hypothetical protein